ncbi:hypothetical protein NLJ89_g7992 [Agrocybe chaxingu]|uniref:Uncharacterized protein n=1 Tax=Agrocybe chaxingu TaxID=84603 RepID=A0A9W8JWA8_9AGAR|nr:hypothetical protein NLJ89_g7992 [Agrocybe chaxingu]
MLWSSSLETASTSLIANTSRTPIYCKLGEPLRRLYLVDCPEIVVKGLKAMITSRNELVSKTASLESGDEEDGDDEDEESVDSDAETIVGCTVLDDEGLENLFEGHRAQAHSSPSCTRAPKKAVEG